MSNTTTLSANTRATLLLCGRFGERNSEARPLNKREFHELDHALEACNLVPKNILEMSAAELKLVGVTHGISSKRLDGLMGRSADLEQTIEAWTEAGIWVLGERDPQYPRRLHQRLTSARPPLLFGAGVIDYLDMGGVCIVGSRASRDLALQFSANLGSRCAREGLTVISNDMRGVDREVVSAALDGSGRAIMVLSDRLEKAVGAKRYREALADNRLTMVTPFSPNTAFSVANAIRVNRYQYVLSDVAVIVETRRKGGIWTGADENRIEKWVPAFVRADQPMSPGNRALLHLGHQAITQKDVENIDSLSEFFISQAGKHVDGPAQPVVSADELDPPTDLYSFFLAEFQAIAKTAAKSETYIMKHFDIERAQARKWLGRAVAEGAAKKTGGQTRYIST